MNFAIVTIGKCKLKICVKNVRRKGDRDEVIEIGNLWNYQPSILYGDGGFLAACLSGI